MSKSPRDITDEDYEKMGRGEYENFQDEFDMDYVIRLASHYDTISPDRHNKISECIPETEGIDFLYGFFIAQTAITAHMNGMNDIMKHAAHLRLDRPCDNGDVISNNILEWHSVCITRICFLLSKFTLEEQEGFVKRVNRWMNSATEDDTITQSTLPS